MRPLFALCLVLGGLATASASYELALMVSGGTKIARYDPVGRVGLGSFGQGDLGYYSGPSLSLNPNDPGYVGVLNGDSGLRRINYSNGIYGGGVSTGAGTYFSNGPLQYTYLNNGNFVVNGYTVGPSGQFSRLHAANGALLATMSPFGNNYVPLSSTVGADNNTYTLNRFNTGADYSYFLFVFNASGTYLGYSTVATGSSLDAYQHVVASGNRIYTGGGGTSTNLNLAVTPLGTAQTTTFAGAGGFLISGLTNLVAGHNGRVHRVHSFLSNGVYNNYWQTYDPISNVIVNSHQIASTEHISSLAMVVAPEPTSLLAIGLGGLALLRRRK